MKKVQSLHRTLNAVIGWLDLGVPAEAAGELYAIEGALRLHPAWLCLAHRVEFACGRMDRAEHWADTGLSLYPERPDFYWLKAGSLFERAAFAEACNILRGMPGPWKNNPRTQVLAARCQIALGHPGLARRHLLAACHGSPGALPPLSGKANTPD